MGTLKALVEPRLRLLAQEREIAALRAEVGQLQAQVDSMKAGMRRCVSCDYRIAFKAGQDRGAAGISNEQAGAPGEGGTG